jgi:hypothetical protein
MTTKIQIQIDPNDLVMIEKAEQFVAISRPSTTLSQARERSAFAVVWQAFQPLPINNVQWDEKFFLQATTQSIGVGDLVDLDKLITTPFNVPYGRCSFTESGFAAIKPGDIGTFEVDNQRSGGSQLTFGLGQSASINDQDSLRSFCLLPVLFNQMGSFSPGQSVSVFLSSMSSCGRIQAVPDAALTIALDPTGTTASIVFDGSTNTFFRRS